MKKQILTGLVSLVLATSLQAVTPKELVISGNTYWSEGKFTEAETQFKKALEAQPDYSVAHERLANLYLTQNKTSDAIEEFQNAITHDAENANLFIGIAIAYLHKQYYQMADAMVKQAIAINPEMKNAQKLKQYIDAKKDIIEQASAAPVDSNHGFKDANHKSMNHGSSAPAAVKKSMQHP